MLVVGIVVCLSAARRFVSPSDTVVYIVHCCCCFINSMIGLFAEMLQMSLLLLLQKTKLIFCEKCSICDGDVYFVQF